MRIVPPLPCAGGGSRALGMQLAYAARGRGPAPTPSTMGFAPWNPDSMHSYAERQARMPTGKLEQVFYDPALILEEFGPISTYPVAHYGNDTKPTLAKR